MNKKSAIFFIIVGVLCLLFGYLTINSSIQRGIIEKEIKKIYEADLTSGKYNYDIKSSFSYAKVETNIKKYISNMNNNYLDIYKLINDSNINSILSYDNYVSDKPEFKNSIKTINDTKSSINKKFAKLINDSNDNNLINEVKNNSPIIYRGFCDQLLNTDTMISYLSDNKDKFIKLRDKYNDLLDNEKLVINFLKDNSDNFELNDGEIQFRNNELLEQYNNLVNKIK